MVIITQEKEMNKKKAKVMLKYLEDKKMGWCFDEEGIIWSRESLSLFLLSQSAWKDRT